MNLQLFSIEHAPVGLPYWQTLMDDLCNPPPARVARVLGIGERSVYRYNATGFAPKPICLAIFWLTRWGRSAVNAQAINDATLMVGYVDSMKRQVADLEGQLAHVLSIGNFGSANAPALNNPRSTKNALPR